MNFTFLKELLSGPWQIESQTFNTLQPIFNGVLNGITFEKEGEPANTIPFAISANSPTNEIVSLENEEEKSEDIIFVLPLRGLLTKHNQECGPVGTRTLSNRLRNADNDKRVIGHIILIESGGGQVSAVAELSEAIQECTKPVVAFVDGMAASAAYYIGSYAKEIIASRDDDYIGCIGTMVEYQGRKALSEANADGLINVRVYATNTTEKNQEYEEAINNGNVSLVQERVLNPLNDKFISEVRSNRAKVTDAHLKGRTFPASEVVGTLIDSIGPFESAIDRVLALANYNPEANTQQNANISNSNKSIQNMNPKLSALVALLAVSNIEIVEGGAHLTQEQLETIGEELANNADLQTQLQTALDSQATAEQNLTAANATIAENVATIEANATEIASLKGEPAVGAIAVTTGDDKVKNESKNVVQGESMNADIEAVTNEYLK